MEDKREILECEVCDAVFESRTDFEKHLSTHTSGKPYHCSVCGRSFSNETKCKKHESSHVVGKPFECAICSIRFTRKGSLTRHMRLHTGENLMSCTHCGKEFTEFNHLEGHLRKHTGEKPYKCSLCDKRFSQKFGLKVHQTVHEGIEMTCRICGKIFLNRGSFNRHMRNHTVDKNWVCSICGKTFRSNYESHMQTHSRETPFQCTVCGKGFKRKTSLRDHALRHEVKIIECLECDEQFPRKIDLRRHIHKQHTNELFDCAECGKGFTTKRSLKEHLVIHSDEPFRCGDCQKIFASLSYLKRHQNMRICVFKYKCFICNQGYKIKARAVLHLKSSHAHEEEDSEVSTSKFDRSFQCSICKKYFSSERSRMWHEVCFHDLCELMEQKDVDDGSGDSSSKDKIMEDKVGDNSIVKIHPRNEGNVTKELFPENAIFIKEEVMNNDISDISSTEEMTESSDYEKSDCLETSPISSKIKSDHNHFSFKEEHVDTIVKEEWLEGFKQEF